MKRAKTFTSMIVLATLGATGIAFAAVQAQDDKGLTAEQLSGSYSAAPVKEVDVAQRQSFGLLRRALIASDRLSKADHDLLDRDGVLAAKYGTNLALTRTVDTGSQVKGTIKVIPGRDFICVAVPDGRGNAGGTCQRTARAEAGGLWTTHSGDAGQAPGEELLVGLVPDGVSSVTVTSGDGTDRQLSVSQNVYAGTVVDARSVTFDAVDGSKQTVDIGPSTEPRS